LLRFILYFLLFFILFRVLRSLFQNLFGNKPDGKIRNDRAPQKSKYENIEEAKYTEIKENNEKEKLNNKDE